MKLQTVNVTVSTCGVLTEIHSFTEDHAGNLEAEALFIERIKAQNPSIDVEDIQNAIADGHYDEGGTELTLIHS